MDDILEKLMESVLAGGPTAVIALLIAVIGFLIWDRKRLTAALDAKDARIQAIIDDYHRGNISMVEALIGLRLVMIEIRAKL